MVYGLKYKVKTLSPVLITGGEGDSRMTATKDYITGRVMLGVFASKYIGKSACMPDKAHEDTRFFKWFLRGDIRFANAYLQIDNKMLLPTPLSIHRDKSSDKIYNLLYKEVDRPTNPAGGYCWLENDRIFFHLPEKRLYFHHFRKDRIKGHSDERGIFFYEAISEGQEFWGTIWGNKNDLKEFRDFYGGRIKARLGRSKKTQYGSIEIELLDIEELNPEIDISQGHIILTFISPVILFNKFGFPEVSVDSLSAYLAQMLGLDPKEIEIEACCARVENIENYTSVWRMKNPADKAFSPGSTFRISFKTSLSDELKNRIKELAVLGIGERRNEGYGRVLINRPLSEELLEEKEKPAKSKGEKPFGDIPVFVKELLMQIIKERVSRILIKKALQDADYCKDNKNEEILSGNLLGRLELMLNTSKKHQDFIKKVEGLQDTAKNKLKGYYIGEKGPLFETISKDLPWEQIFAGLRDLDKISREIGYRFQEDEELKEDLFKKYWRTFFRSIRMQNKKGGKPE